MWASISPSPLILRVIEPDTRGTAASLDRRRDLSRYPHGIDADGNWLTIMTYHMSTT